MPDTDPFLEFLIKTVFQATGYLMREQEAATLKRGLSKRGHAPRTPGDSALERELASLIPDLQKLLADTNRALADIGARIHNAPGAPAASPGQHSTNPRPPGSTPGEPGPHHLRQKESKPRGRKQKWRPAGAPTEAPKNSQPANPSGHAGGAGALNAAEARLVHSLETISIAQHAALAAAQRLLDDAVTKTALLNDYIVRLAALIERIPDPRIFADRLRELETEVSDLSHRSDRPQS